MYKLSLSVALWDGCFSTYGRRREESGRGNLALIIIAMPLADLSQARVDQDLILYRERRNVLCRSADNEGLLASPPFILLWRQLILPLFPLKTMW